VLAALGGIGHGVAAVSYALVGSGPQGWRYLYLAGALPLVIVAWLRRSLVETRRFVAARSRRGGDVPSALAPLLALLRAHPGRVGALAAMVLPIYFLTAPALAFQSKFLQEAHGYTPATVAGLYFVGGLVSVATQLAVGRTSDAIGRKPAVVLMVALTAAGTLVLYCGSGTVVLIGWVVMIAAYLGLDVLVGALGSELFPTVYRSTASAARAVTATIGAASGLALEGVLYGRAGSHGVAISWMVLPLVLVPAALAALPETARRELEEIAPE
jgi:MFS family permease